MCLMFIKPTWNNFGKTDRHFGPLLRSVPIPCSLYTINFLNSLNNNFSIGHMFSPYWFERFANPMSAPSGKSNPIPVAHMVNLDSRRNMLAHAHAQTEAMKSRDRRSDRLNSCARALSGVCRWWANMHDNRAGICGAHVKRFYFAGSWRSSALSRSDV